VENNFATFIPTTDGDSRHAHGGEDANELCRDHNQNANPTSLK
jgi:hypothetical protein